MPNVQAKPVTITNLRGRDGSSASTSGIPLDKAKEMLNVDLYRARFARKRPGCTALSLTFSGGGGPFATNVLSLGVTGTALDPVLWAADPTQIAFKAGASSWVEPSLVATVFIPPTQYLPFDARAYMNAFLTGADRMVVYDGTSIRFTGMATPAQPAAPTDTGANIGYAAVLRYYRVRYAVLSGTTVLRMGEASASRSFTPDAAHTAARVAKPAATSPSEGETHWRVEVSLDDAVWYVLSAWTVVATTTYDDGAATTTYPTNDAAPLAGEFSNWPWQTCLSSDGSRLIGARGKTLSWSPVIGTTSSGFLDCERVPNTVVQKNYMTIVGDSDDGDITAVSLPFLGAIWVFKRTAIHRLTTTSVDTAAYKRTQYYAGSGIGCLNQRTIVYGNDEYGAPALYFLSARGPYRITNAGLQWLGEDIMDLWSTRTTNGELTHTMPHGCADPDRHQVWWWAPLAGIVNNTRLVFDWVKGRVEEGGEVRGGWTIANGNGALVTASATASFYHTNSGENRDDLRPFMAMNVSLGTKIWYRNDSAWMDDDTEFQGLVTLPERHYAGDDHALAITGASVVGSASTAGVAGAHTLRLTLAGDYGAVTARTFDAVMSTSGSETRKRATFEGASMTDVSAVSAAVGDYSGATFVVWSIDELRLLVEPRELLVP